MQDPVRRHRGRQTGDVGGMVSGQGVHLRLLAGGGVHDEGELGYARAQGAT